MSFLYLVKQERDELGMFDVEMSIEESEPMNPSSGAKKRGTKMGDNASASTSSSAYRKVGVGQYKCNICSKSYSQSNSLAEHLRYHEGDFKCHFCGKQLSKKSHLNRHIRRTHGQNP